MDQAAQFYAENKEYGNIQNAVDYFLKFEIEKDKRILDIGTNFGSLPHELHVRGYKDVRGIDVREDAITKGQQRYPVIRDRLSCYDGHVIPFADGSFDVITMFDVIEHVPDPTRDMQVVWAMLKPGGLFIVSTPNIDGLFPRLSLKVAGALDYWPHPEPPHHLYQFSVRTLSAMLAKAGFKVEGERQINIDLAYSFGTPATLAKMPKRLAYAALFAPIAKLGPWVGQGDWFYLAARKV